jgi:hypothetical protein
VIAIGAQQLDVFWETLLDEQEVKRGPVSVFLAALAAVVMNVVQLQEVPDTLPTTPANVPIALKHAVAQLSPPS